MGQHAIAFAVVLLLGCGRGSDDPEAPPERTALAPRPTPAEEPAAELAPDEPSPDPEREPTGTEPEATSEPRAPSPAEQAVREPDDGERGRCPPGTCVVRASRGCERPTGQLGNGCCRCGDDGRCATYCRCNGPHVPVDTPGGPRPIAELELGDRVYTLVDGARVIAPVCAVGRREAPPDGWVRVTLDDGRSFVTSAVHPLADRRAVEDLSTEEGVRSVAPARAPSPVTYDVRPASPGGTYFVAGMAFSSTLRTGDRCR